MLYFIFLTIILSASPKSLSISKWFFFPFMYTMNIHAKMRTIKTKHELFTAAQSFINFMEYV